MNGTILTGAEMRAAEARAIRAGTPVETLMERAGLAAAEAVWRYSGPLPALVLCGPGNNGGDGYVVARVLRERGMNVRVAGTDEPKSDAARAARMAWAAPIESMETIKSAPLLIDALFGTGLGRGLDPVLADGLGKLAMMAKVKVAIDLPSGVATDDGAILSPVPDFDLTVTFQTLKPAHLLQPAARHMGRLVVADIGIEAVSQLKVIGRPLLRSPGADDHKYRRGFVVVIAGEMPGAAALTASAAAKAGAGYVSLVSQNLVAGVPRAVVQGRCNADALADERVGAVAIGAGLGRSEQARRLLDQALGCGHPIVFDADALNILSERGPPVFSGVPILTPHAGEFARLFPEAQGSKVERARSAAWQSQSVLIYKGADTVVSAPDGRAAIAGAAPFWLATAGTGDVLTGIVAAFRASGMEAFEAACAAVWVHGRAAERAGAVMIADDLLDHIGDAIVEAL